MVDGEKLNRATDFSLDTFSTYHDISHLFPSNAEQLSAYPKNLTMMAAATLALGFPVIPTGKATDAVTSNTFDED
jgi:hypothetical protein